MPQTFRPWANIVARWTAPALVFLGLGGVALSAVGVRSDYYTGVGTLPPQPVQFSHKHHVQGLGLDCRYCHQVSTHARASLPDLRTCMGCHREIWPTSPALEPVRSAWREGRPLAWNQVTYVPDHVYFNHSIHVAKGVGCVTCHGRVSEMALTERKRAFWMKDCLECHRHPQKYLRPQSEVFNENWHAPNQEALGARLAEEYRVHPSHLTQCSVCHR